jgi:hypothetical protein
MVGIIKNETRVNFMKNIVELTQHRLGIKDFSTVKTNKDQREIN